MTKQSCPRWPVSWLPQRHSARCTGRRSRGSVPWVAPRGTLFNIRGTADKILFDRSGRYSTLKGRHMSHPRMSWEKLLSRSRLGPPDSSPTTNPYRSAFEADIDRIMFSGAFRRLSRKTQVHPLAANDHVHTRLTHSLEVAQVGRTLGKAVAVRIQKEKDDLENITPNDLGAVVQAACLAHDLV